MSVTGTKSHERHETCPIQISGKTKLLILIKVEVYYSSFRLGVYEATANSLTMNSLHSPKHYVNTHIGAPKRCTNMASPYKALQRCVKRFGK